MTVPVKSLPDTQAFNSFGASADIDPHVTALADGGFQIGFTEPLSGSDFDTFSADGTSRVTFSLSQSDSQLSAYGLADATEVRTWTHTPQATGDADIQGTLESLKLGTIIGGPTFTVNVGDTAGNQVRPEVVQLTSELSAFAWIDTATSSVKSAVFNMFGVGVRTNLTVSTTPSSQGGGAFDLGMAPLANGNYVVSWRADDFTEHFQILDIFGFPVTGDLTVGTGNDGAGDVIQLANGNLEFVYLSVNGITGRTFTAAGVPLGAEFPISSGGGDFPAVTTLHDGRFMAVYEKSGDIFGRIMNDTGVPAGPEFRVNTVATGIQGHPHLDTLADGRVVVAWEDSRTGNGDIYYTILNVLKAHDFDGDGFSDLVLQTAGGQTALWEMDSHGLKDSLSIGNINPAYVIQDIADFNHDGHSDLLFRNSSSGETLLWLMNGNQNTGQFDIGTINPNYVIQAAADFNGDGNADILFRGTAAGDAVLWTMNGGVNTGQFSIGTLNPNYKIQAVNDFDGDGKADILFRGASGGDAIIWTMNGPVNTGQFGIGTINLSYHVAGTGDFNGDGNADILWRSDAGELVLWTMKGGTNTGQFTVGPVNPIYQVADIEDFNGDGKADILFRSSNDEVIWTMNGATNIGQVGLAATGIDNNAFQVVQHHYDLV